MDVNLSLHKEEEKKCSPEEFYTVMGVHYLTDLIFDVNLSDKISYDAEQCELGECYSEDIISGNIDLVIKRISPVVGYGVFALRDFKSGEFLGEYTGVVKDSRDSPPDNQYNIAYLRNRKRTYYIDAQYSGSYMRFVNHSGKANVCGIFVVHKGIRKAIFIAWKPIKKGEQLFFNYGQNYWKGCGKKPLDLN